MQFYNLFWCFMVRFWNTIIEMYRLDMFVALKLSMVCGFYHLSRKTKHVFTLLVLNLSIVWLSYQKIEIPQTHMINRKTCLREIRYVLKIQPSCFSYRSFASFVFDKRSIQGLKDSWTRGKNIICWIAEETNKFWKI